MHEKEAGCQKVSAPISIAQRLINNLLNLHHYPATLTPLDLLPQISTITLYLVLIKTAFAHLGEVRVTRLQKKPDRSHDKRKKRPLSKKFAPLWHTPFQKLVI